MYSQMAKLIAVVTFIFVSSSVCAGELTQSVNQLVSKSLLAKEKAVVIIAEENGVLAVPIFNALLESRLYYRKSDKRLVYVSVNENEYQMTDVFSTENIGVTSKRKLKKVSINNKIRSRLQEMVARLDLRNTDVKIRRAAAKKFIVDAKEMYLPLIESRLKVEADSGVIESLRSAQAVVLLKSGSDRQRLDAVSVLRDSLLPEVKAKLQHIYADPEHEDYIEASEVRVAAAEAVTHIEYRVERYQFAETLMFGLSLGSVLLLAAIGLAITFGVMGVINMAHGELIMIGAYTTYVVQLLMPNAIEYSLLVAIPAAFIIAGLVGVAIERGVIRHLYGRPLETLLATFGISLILQQLARSIFSPLNRSVETPEWMAGALEINAVLSITYTRLYVIIFALLVFFLLLLLMKKTSLGLKVRAVSQNRAMARSMGIKSDWVDALTFGLGAGLAGLAGVALSQLTNVGPNMGQAYIIDSFMVVVFGGVGNLWGTLVAALSLGVVNKFMEPWAGAVLAKILILIFIILFIQKRPKGLFPQKGRVVED